MVENPPEGFPQITPYLLYEDVDRAVDALVSMFGFTERFRMAGPDGRALHAEVEQGEGVVMLGNPGPEFKSPRHLGAATQLVYVYVNDVDAHFESARRLGATIISEVADQFYGDRTYTAADPEGHQWTFAEHTRDVEPDQMALN